MQHGLNHSASFGSNISGALPVQEQVPLSRQGKQLSKSLSELPMEHTATRLQTAQLQAASVTERALLSWNQIHPARGGMSQALLM